ncbi:hypothetical protein EON67_08445 [archaeon]|nr:MAG: hypothetical protein EON67_08445 [archaeon]
MYSRVRGSGGTHCRRLAGQGGGTRVFASNAERAIAARRARAPSLTAGAQILRRQRVTILQLIRMEGAVCMDALPDVVQRRVMGYCDVWDRRQVCVCVCVTAVSRRVASSMQSRRRAR